ncbi:MAG: dephospho-CoA kinase [Clostridia bacterium]|nr:dephospho-CoA kinase [Clostridia bacterium]
MLVIGLCGSSGAGKGYVCRAFEKYGVAYIDTDLVYHQLIDKSTPCSIELAFEFGKEILRESGGIDRAALAQRVFSSRDALLTLNKIAHKHIRKKTEALIEDYRSKGKVATIVDAPVLFESGFDDMCDYTICVVAPTELKLKRIMERDNITEEMARKRLDNQLTDKELTYRCDFTIKNSEGENLEDQILGVLSKLKFDK